MTSPVPPPKPDAKRQQAEQLAASAAAKSGIAYFDTTILPQPVETLADLLTLADLRHYGVAPLQRYSPTSVEMGLTNLTDRALLPELQQKLGHVQLTFKTISQEGYTDVLNRVYYQSLGAERGGDFDRFGLRLAQTAPRQAFTLIAQLAYWLGASDIHIEPQAGSARIRFRIDGLLHPITTVGTKSYEVFLSDLQTRAEITWGSDKPQSGRISLALMDNQAQMRSVNLRIETLPTFHGEEIVTRIFNTSARLLQLEQMGFSPAQIKRLDAITSHPSGMVLTVGPTGSGKTSTLYAIINRLNKPDTKIVTLEDPVEYDLPGVSQLPVRTEDKELFAEKLRAVMREDPNVVMIGEIRDIDTAKTALQAALTGHLVLSTFHATDAAAAVSRMLDMVSQNPLFTSAVRMIVAQRLARRVCPDCKETSSATAEERGFLERSIKVIPEERRPEFKTELKLTHGKGCPACHGIGYRGRVAIVEIMAITPAIEQLMVKASRTTAQEVAAEAMKGGMATLLEDGITKALAGLTTVDEIQRLMDEPTRDTP
jgi:type II secretory ATPase GspE/PulE/Tfp pilus assembly ATPase PilB-like protein